MFVVAIGILAGCAPTRFHMDPQPGHTLFEQVPPRAKVRHGNWLNCKGTADTNPSCWNRLKREGHER